MSLECIFNEFYTKSNNVNILSCVHSLNIIECSSKVEYDSKYTNLFIESGKLLALSYILGDSSIFYDGLDINNYLPSICFTKFNTNYDNLSKDISKCLSSKDIASIIINNSALPKVENIKNNNVLELIELSPIYYSFLLHGFSTAYNAISLNKNEFIFTLDSFDTQLNFIHVIKKNIHALNSLDLKRQTDFISTIFIGNNTVTNSNYMGEDFPLISNLESAQYIGDYIIECSIISYLNRKIDRAWIGYTLNPSNNKKIVSVLGDSLLDGTLGLIFFILTLYKYTKINYYLSISTEIIESILIYIKDLNEDSLKEALFILDYYNRISNTETYTKTLNKYKFIYKKLQFDIFINNIYSLIRETPLTIDNYSIKDFKKPSSLHNLGLNNGLSSIGLKLLLI